MTFARFVFHGLCHQLPERALQTLTFTMPLCARCAGVYVAMALVLPVFLLLGRRRAGAPTAGFLAVSCLVWLAFAADAVAGFLRIWDSPAVVRFAFGVTASGFLCPYVARLFHATVARRTRHGPIADGWAILWLLTLSAIFSALNLAPSRTLLVAETAAAVAGVFLLLWVAHAAVLVLILGISRLRAAVVVAPFTAAGQIAAFSLLRSLAGI